MHIYTYISIQTCYSTVMLIVGLLSGYNSLPRKVGHSRFRRAQGRANMTTAHSVET